MRVRSPLFVLALAVTAGTARAEEPRVHATAGAAHAVGAPQGSELGPGASGGAAVELPLTRAFGVQGSGNVMALSKGSAPSDPTLASRSTGTAVWGTVGLRFHPMAVAGLWLDANGGVAQTGDATRPAMDAHLGWDFRVARGTRWDVGPYVGYTQIFEPSSSLRPEDAHVLSLGIAISMGAREREAPPPPAAEPPAPPPPPPPVVAAVKEEPPPCPEDTERAEDGSCVAIAKIAIVDDRIVLDDVIHFEFDSARIRTASRRLVRDIARFIVAHGEIVAVSIEGHADARGTEVYNQKLSEARADSTRAMLVEYGVPADHLAVVGFGKSRLKVDTQAPEPENRRVEFIVQRHRELEIKRGTP